MSKVLIDTPAMPVKAYYHEWTDLEGVRTRSVGLEVRKEFPDAPLVLESDALARIACLEGEIAKRDETIARLEPQLNRAIQANYDLREELAACRIAVENCDLFRARIVELESRYQRDVYGLNNEGDPIGGDPAGGYANDNARLRSELAAIKAQEPVGWYTEDHLDDKSATTYSKELADRWVAKGWPVFPLYAAPVSEAKAQGAVMPEQECKVFAARYICNWDGEGEICYALVEKHKDGSFIHIENGAPLIEYKGDKILNLWPLGLAAPVQQVSVPDDSDNIKHITKCVDDDCERCDNLLRFYQTCDECGSVGHNDAPCRCAAAQAAPSHGEQVRDALAELLECPASVVQATVPHAGIEAAPPYQVVLDVSVSLTRWKKARAALEAAAPAAPAADAGMVDMYRHLQKVTPYRFKKIQDASITDGGDVMYFHKDRFDAALLADMAAHCAAKGGGVMKIGDRYNWKNQPERLVYIGMCEPRNGRWHQFEKVDEPGVVWCEVQPQDMYMLELTKEPSHD